MASPAANPFVLPGSAAAALSPTQQRFVRGFVQTTHLDPTVAAAWVRNEEPKALTNTDPTGHGAYNFLNVGITDSAPYGAAAGFWKNPDVAGRATGNWLAGKLAIPGFGHSSAGIQAITKAAGLTPAQQIAAIRGSGWASGGESALESLYRQFSGGKPVTLPGAPAAPAAPASVAAATPSAAAPATNPFLQGILQRSLDSSQTAAQGAFSALGKISGSTIQAPDAPNLAQLTQGTLTGAAPAPTSDKVVPLHGAAPVKGLDTQGKKAVALAKQYLGTPYLYGGANPKTGFDCSGLLQYVWSRNGVQIPHNAAAQYEVAKKIPESKLQPGDAVFFSNTDGPGVTHVGMFIGNGQFIQAPHTGDHVKISNLSDPYYQAHFTAGGRFT